jgi:hypothetical protein
MARRTQTVSDDAGPMAKTAGASAPRTLSLVEPSPPGAKALQLFHDARAASIEHLALVAEAMTALRDRLEAVGEGGDLYVAGVSEFAERLAEELFWRAKSFDLLVQRQRESLQPRARRR